MKSIQSIQSRTSIGTPRKRRAHPRVRRQGIMNAARRRYKK